MSKLEVKLDEYIMSVQDLTCYFTNKYFDDCDFDWIGGDIGGVVDINGYFFDFSNILDFLKYDYSEDKMFEYYDYALEEAMADRSPINIKNYLELIPSKK